MRIYYLKFLKMSVKNSLNIVFSIALALVILIAFGIIPRQFAFLILALYLGFVLFAPIERGVDLFLRSIPFFIALPITETFDNFNAWRLVVLVIFLKWLLTEYDWRTLFQGNLFNPARNRMQTQAFAISYWVDKFLAWVKANRVEALGVSFFVFAVTSLLVAPELTAGIKRIIFIANAAMLFVVVRALIIKNSQNVASFVKNFAYSGLMAVGFGYLQFIAAYLVPAWIFHYWWGQVVSVNMYGVQWGDIATNFGNTWFSYSGDTLRLRMFSTFPDSHSFPMYVIMTLPALIVFFVKKYKIKILNFKALFARYALLVAVLLLIFLAIVLTGTRGIWIASLSALFVVGLFKLMKIPKQFSKIVLALFLIFLLMFPMYYAIVSFPQFQDSGFTGAAALKRFESLVDFGETSNKGRIYIWKTTIQYIQKSPVLGIGIGNYPLILKEPQSAALAGASAHNLYLDIAATMGIFALAVFLWMLLEIVKILIRHIKKHADSEWALYAAVMIFSLAWIAAYLLTDSALYDGRALLGFMAMTGIGVGLGYAKSNNDQS